MATSDIQGTKGRSMKRIYLIVGIVVLLILAFAAIADRTMVEQRSYSVLSYCLNLQTPSQLITVKVVKGQEAINVQP
jgi:nucleoside permease NupC